MSESEIRRKKRGSPPRKAGEKCNPVFVLNDWRLLVVICYKLRLFLLHVHHLHFFLASLDCIGVAIKALMAQCDLHWQCTGT